MPEPTPCSVLTIDQTGLHHYAWAADMLTALQVCDPFQETAYLKSRYVVAKNQLPRRRAK